MLPRLASNSDAEVVATARAIERILQANQQDWHDLVALISDAGTAAKLGSGEIAEILAAAWKIRPRFRQNELGFVTSLRDRFLAGRTTLSDKQEAWLFDIADKYGLRPSPQPPHS